MIWRKIRLMWPVVFLVPPTVLCWVAILNGEAGIPFIVFTLMFTTGTYQFIRYYLRLQPEEIAAEERTNREMWIGLIAATVVLVAAILGMVRLGWTSTDNEMLMSTVVYAVLLPVTAFVAIRGALRARRAKRDAAKRLSREAEQP